MNLSRLLGTGGTIVTFVGVAFTGVSLFLGFRFGLLKTIHEYIGVGMVAFALAHVLLNWKGFCNYFSSLKGVAIGVLCVAICVACFFDFGKKPNPAKQFGGVSYNAVKLLRLGSAGESFGTSDDITRFLSAMNLPMSNLELRLQDFIKDNNLDEAEVLKLVLPPMKKGK